MNKAFVIDSRDNVATVLQAVAAGEHLQLLGDASQMDFLTQEAIRAEHKVALQEVAVGEAIIKYGMPIGSATQNIAPGDWVHLHNCASNYDKRSNTLDGDTGESSDIEYV